MVVAAFLRGNYLFGPGCGVVYSVISLALLGFLSRSRVLSGRLSATRTVLVTLVAISVGYVMAFPASLNPDVQVFIDKQATDRRTRAELAAVFASDPAYHELSVSSVQLKVVNITVSGPLGSRFDLERLRPRLAGECPAMGECLLHWDVVLLDTGERVSGLDRDLYAGEAPPAQPHRGHQTGPGR